MKAMILAAGKGTRVRPITHTTPKPMIPILQKPVMEFLLELLREHGFDEIMVNDVVSVLPNAPIAEVAALMAENRIHRVAVVENNQCIGLITSLDLLQHFGG